MVVALDVSVFVSILDGEAFALVKISESLDTGIATAQFAPVAQSVLPPDPCHVLVAAEAGSEVKIAPASTRPNVRNVDDDIVCFGIFMGYGIGT